MYWKKNEGTSDVSFSQIAAKRSKKILVCKAFLLFFLTSSLLPCVHYVLMLHYLPKNQMSDSYRDKAYNVRDEKFTSLVLTELLAHVNLNV